ncbi:hypothetical protein HOF92_13570 [bacterium]|jgi:hypothetical protein|nr:hypothetical protein [bacterium]
MTNAKVNWSTKNVFIGVLAAVVNLSIAIPGSLVCIYAFMVATTGTTGWNDYVLDPASRLLVVLSAIVSIYLFIQVFYQIYKHNFKLVFLGLASNAGLISLSAVILNSR